MASAMQKISNAIIIPFVVASGQTVTKGKTVKFSSTLNQIQDAGAASDAVIGVARASGIAGDLVEVTTPFVAVEKMLVGTGATTQGLKQKVVSDGITDAPADNGATTSVPTVGIALESGVLGDYVGVGLELGNRTTT